MPQLPPPLSHGWETVGPVIRKHRGNGPLVTRQRHAGAVRLSGLRQRTSAEVEGSKSSGLRMGSRRAWLLAYPTRPPTPPPASTTTTPSSSTPYTPRGRVLRLEHSQAAPPWLRRGRLYVVSAVALRGKGLALNGSPVRRTQGREPHTVRDVPQLHFAAQVPCPSSTVRGGSAYSKNFIGRVNGDLIRVRIYVLMKAGVNQRIL